MKEKLFGDIETMILFFGIIAVTILVATVINYSLNRAIKRNTGKLEVDLTKYQFLKHFLVGLVYLVGIGWAFLIIPPFKTVAHTLLTGAGIVTLVAGLASQQALSNITSGFFIVIFKPFRINDRITIRGDQTGIVEDITLRHTVIRNFENNRMIIPNSVISTEIIINAHLADKKIVRKIDIGVSYDSDVEKALEMMREEVKNHPSSVQPDKGVGFHEQDEEVFAQILSLADSAVILRVWAWANQPTDATRMEGDLLKSIKARFDSEGIEIPFPQRVVTHKNHL